MQWERGCSEALAARVFLYPPASGSLALSHSELEQPESAPSTRESLAREPLAEVPLGVCVWGGAHRVVSFFLHHHPLAAPSAPPPQQQGTRKAPGFQGSAQGASPGTSCISPRAGVACQSVGFSGSSLKGFWPPQLRKWKFQPTERGGRGETPAKERQCG